MDIKKDMNIDVSIVIVCMNNLKNLYPCLESIKKHTTVSYETLVVAYLFSKENLEKVKNDFPWVTFIESNEIRGFSENNNLALRQAKGKYCFVLNDDTEMKMDVVGGLIKTIESLPENVAIVSPVTTFPDGRVQVCGRPPMNWVKVALGKMHLWNEKKSKWVNKSGVFRSYNIIGAAFLIKTNLFDNVGWFDEYYFFCPEDIALSTTLNEKGYECWVNADVHLIHYEGMSGKSLSMIKCATAPASRKGNMVFFSNGNKMIYLILGLSLNVLTTISALYHFIKSQKETRPNKNYVLMKSEINTLFATFSAKTPKELFIKYYARIKNAR